MKNSSSHGFTLLEVLIATALFAVAIFAIIKSGSGSSRSVKESQLLFRAVQAAESKMTELELKYQKQIDRDGIKDTPMAEENGTFEAPFEELTWSSKLVPSTMKIDEASMRALLKTFGVEEDVINEQMEDPAQRLVFANINKAIKENFAELVVTVSWSRFGRKYTMPLVTHLIPTKPKISLTQNADEFSADSSSGTSESSTSSGGSDSTASPSGTSSGGTEAGKP